MRPLKSLSLLVAWLPLAACQTLHPPVALPAALELKPREAWVDTLPARGVQVYECRDKAGAPGWTFVAPDAELFDRKGQPFGHHGGGPTWQAEDGSLVVGQVLARAEAPVAGAVPWLLVEARNVGHKGALADVTHIRRVHTVGGQAPGAGCDALSRGKRLRVPYTADYLLYSGPRS